MDWLGHESMGSLGPSMVCTRDRLSQCCAAYLEQGVLANGTAEISMGALKSLLPFMLAGAQIFTLTTPTAQTSHRSLDVGLRIVQAPRSIQPT